MKMEMNHGKDHRSAYHHMMGIVAERPLDLSVEVINQCPLRCCFCCNRKIPRDAQAMDMGLFQAICREYAALGGGGIGLSVMHSDVFLDPLLLDRLAFLQSLRPNMYIYMDNPLVSLQRYNDDEVRDILESMDYLLISVLGTNKETYRRMSGIDGFSLFLKNLYRVRNMMEKYHIELKLELAFRTDDVQMLQQDEMYQRLYREFPCVEAIDAYFDWYGKIQPEDLPPKAKLIRKDNQAASMDCAAACSTLAIEVDGSVVGCGCIDWNREHVIGKCGQNSLQEIWQSDAAKRFRHAFSLGHLPDMCKHCGLYTPVVSAYGRSCLCNYRPMDGIYYSIERNKR